MKCSLLTLSSLVDEELDARHRGEVEAHLVGCQRCGRGLENLREEVTRIRQLAPIHVADDSLASLMVHVGLVDNESDLPERTRPAARAAADPDAPHWLGSSTGTALPWRAPRPTTPRPAVMPASFGGVAWRPDPPASPPASDDPPADHAAASPPPAQWPGPEAVATSAPSSPDEVTSIAPPDGPAESPAGVVNSAPRAFIDDMPSPASRPATDDSPEPVSGRDQEFDVIPPPPPPLDIETLSDADIAPPVTPTLPRRLRPARARVGLIDRLRERIALTRVLRSAPTIGDDDVEVFSGAGAPVQRRDPRRRSHRPETHVDVIGSAQASAPLPAPTSYPVPAYEPPPAEPWPFATGDPLAADNTLDTLDEANVDDGPPPIAHFPSDAIHTRTDDFASLRSLREEAIRTQEARRRRTVPRQMLSVANAIDTSALVAWFPHQFRRLTRRHGLARFDQRTFAVMGLALVALCVGWVSGVRVTTPYGPTSSTHAGTSGSASQSTASADHSQTAQSQPATPAATPVPLAITSPVTLGSGGTGVHVMGVRYGEHPGDFRIVVDLSGATSPTTVVGFTDPQTLVVVFDGTSSVGNLGALPSTNVVTSVSQLPATTAGQTVIQFRLAHPVTTAQGYLAGPLRLVLDLS